MGVVATGRKKENKNNKGAFGLMAWWACDLRGPKKKRKKGVCLVCVNCIVAHWVLGAHMLCFEYRVEVQKY